MPKEKISVSDVLKDLNKKYGAGSIIDGSDIFQVDSISTGIYQLDDALGAGLPKGRIIELFGEPSSGKSVLSMYLASVIQKRGGKVALIDAEQSFDSKFAEKIGVDTKKMIISQTETLEQAVDTVDKLIETNELDLIIVDSVASMVPEKELEGEILASNVALQARLMNQAMRVLTGSVNKSKVVLLFINQVRDNIGSWTERETTPGGKALKFYSSVRIKVRRGDKLTETIGGKDQQVGNWLKIEIKKNKCAVPYKTAEFELYWESGVDTAGSLLDYALEKGVIGKEGNTYMFGKTKLGVGRDKAKEFLKADKKVGEEIAVALDKLKDSLKSV